VFYFQRGTSFGCPYAGTWYIPFKVGSIWPIPPNCCATCSAGSAAQYGLHVQLMQDNCDYTRYWIDDDRDFDWDWQLTFQKQANGTVDVCVSFLGSSGIWLRAFDGTGGNLLGQNGSPQDPALFGGNNYFYQGPSTPRCMNVPGICP
jgi:hypothetical protein